MGKWWNLIKAFLAAIVDFKEETRQDEVQAATAKAADNQQILVKTEAAIQQAHEDYEKIPEDQRNDLADRRLADLGVVSDD